MHAISNHPKTGFRTFQIAIGILAVFLVVPYGQESAAVLGQEPACRQSLLMPYEQHVASVDEQHSLRMSNTQVNIPQGFQPWWSQYLERPLWESSRALTIDVETLVVGAIRNSPKVLALSTIPEIRQTEIAVAEATFDPRAFLESKFIRTSDTATTILTAGGDTTATPRYRDQNWYYSGGVRKKTGFGGQFEAAQKFGLESNNAIIFEPYWALYPQGSARLTLSYTQPLLNGAGRAYNESVIVLAAIGADIAADQFAAELQNHLLEVNRAYWTLYLERVTLLQKRHLLNEAERIWGDLDARKNFDANTGQIIRVAAAVDARRASLVRSDAAVHNAESRINLLVNDPKLISPERAELIPIQRPNLQYPNIGVRDSLITALHNRPEINASLKEIRAACIREKIACKDLLPVLDAVLSTYAMGLQGDSRMGQAWVDQFTVGEPGYTTGLMLEVPMGNRSAKARLYKRQLEFRQFSLQLRQVVAVLVEEIEVAVRDIDASFREAQAQYLAMNAANTEIKYLEERWRLLPSEDQVAGIVLEDLLAAQERCGIAEIGFASAQVRYNLALANLNRATGILLRFQTEFPPSERDAPTQDRLEEIPLPPSDLSTPLPPPISNLPTTSARTTSTNNNVQPRANLNRDVEITEKLPPVPLPAEQGASMKTGVKTPPPSPGEVLAPLPPPVTSIPTTTPGSTSAVNIPGQSSSNSSRSAQSVDKSQPKPQSVRRHIPPENGTHPSKYDDIAPLPPPINNNPAAAATTASTKAIIVR